VPETSPPDKTWVRLLGLSEKAPDTILAWLLAQGEDIAPIPGTKKRSRLAENLGAINVTLSANDLSQLDELAPAGVAAGDRYASMATIDR
jgi:aryl-alcohol dehydrogenase-like predicted oxidoreductase